MLRLFHDGRQFVNLLTGMQDTDFLERFLFADSFLPLLLLFDALPPDLIWAAISAACFASSSAIFQNKKKISIILKWWIFVVLTVQVMLGKVDVL